VLGRSEFGMEIVVAMAYLVYESSSFRCRSNPFWIAFFPIPAADGLRTPNLQFCFLRREFQAERTSVRSIMRHAHGIADYLETAICWCQPNQPRVSYSSNPHSPLAASKLCSTDQWLPRTQASFSSDTSAGALER